MVGKKRSVQARAWSRSPGKRLHRTEPDSEHDLQTRGLFDLPAEILMMIFYFLPYTEIVSMTQTCKFFNTFFRENYSPCAMIPLPTPLYLPTFQLRHCKGKYVLRLESLLQTQHKTMKETGKLESLVNLLRNVKMSRLQKLVFHADLSIYNPYSYDQYEYYNPRLPKLYKDILKYYLSFSSRLTHINIAVDGSEESFEIIDSINSKSFPCLSKVVLQAADTLSTYNYNTNLSYLLEKLMKNLSIEYLEIHELLLDRPDPAGCNEPFALILFGSHLKHLKINHQEVSRIWLECPELIDIEFKSGEGPESELEKTGCLFHHDIFSGGCENALIEDCPKLERLNDIDIKSLRSRVTGQDPFMEWESLLESLCHCDVCVSEDNEDEEEEENE